MPPRGRPFEKGKSGNPSGRSKLDKQVESAQKMNYSDFLTLTEKYGFLTRKELEALVKDPDTNLNTLIILRLLADSAQGKPEARKTYLERRFGKVKEVLHHSADENMPQIVISIPDNKRDKGDK